MPKILTLGFWEYEERIKETGGIRRYDALVHSWFVFLGYGAAPDNGTSSVDLFNVIDTGKTFDLRELRNHRNYTFGLSHVKNRGENWSLHIFDKRTMWEVARL